MERVLAAASQSLQESICHHVALPARLPSRREGSLEKIETALANLLLEACTNLRDATDFDSFGKLWECIQGAIKTARHLNADGRLAPETLLAAFRELKGDQVLILHVSEQNAGLLIRRIHKSGELQSHSDLFRLTNIISM